MSKFAIMMVGKTHSGKTTFARELEKIINGVVLQTDPIIIFLKKEFSVNLDKDKEHDGSFKNPSLKIKIFNTIFEHILKKGNLIPILSNSNMYQKLRDQIILYLRKNNIKVIGVYLNFSEQFLINRIEKSQKSTEVLSVSKDYKECLINQRKRFIEPRENEFDYFFEVNSEDELADVKNKIKDIIKK